MQKTKSIVTEYDEFCAICGTPTTHEHHLIFGTYGRQLAEEDGLKLPICDHCHTLNPIKARIHDNSVAEKLSRMVGQLAFEKRKCAEGSTEQESREIFRRRYGVSYL